MRNLHNLKEKIIAQSPTEEQTEAIFSEDEEFLLRAAPGSGKTWTSCRRFIWRGAQWDYESGGIALMSFTNVAIREFKNATARVGRGDLLSDPNYVGTFDSFVERFIITPFGHLISDTTKRPKLFSSPRPSDWDDPNLKVWVKTNGRNIPKHAWQVIPFPEDDKIKFKTSNFYNDQVLPFEQAKNAVLSLLGSGYYTHAQRAFWGVILLSKRPHIASLLARRFPVIIVDEAQDTNAWLIVLLNLIREKGSKITLVGDPDQCIYEFSMADATSLLNLKDKWEIPEKPLSKSFRCNDQIASVVKVIGGNKGFTGYGPSNRAEYKAYVYCESSDDYQGSVDTFQGKLKSLKLDRDKSAIVCRGHKELELMRGKVNYKDLQGSAKRLAKAAFLRDSMNDFHEASKTVEKVLREITGDDPYWEIINEKPDSIEARHMALCIWRFVKDGNKLPSVNLVGSNWISTVKKNIEDLIVEIGLNPISGLGYKINKRGLSNDQLSLPLFVVLNEFPKIRTETIHKVKGESIDAVMTVGSTRFWNSVVDAIENGENTEDRRLAYVAMTRARHFLFVSLPENHFNTHSKKWVKWGFEVIDSSETIIN